MVNEIDFGKLTETIPPEQLAEVLNLRPSGRPQMFFCPGPAHENGDKKGDLWIVPKNGKTDAHCFSCDFGGTRVQVAAHLP